MLAEGDRRVPVDAAVGPRRHMRGRVDAPGGGRRVAPLPAGLGDLDRPDPAGQGDPRAHLRSPGAGPRGVGPAPRTAERAQPAGRPWPPRPDPTGTARPAQRRPGTAPTEA